MLRAKFVIEYGPHPINFNASHFIETDTPAFWIEQSADGVVRLTDYAKRKGHSYAAGATVLSVYEDAVVKLIHYRSDIRGEKRHLSDDLHQALQYVKKEVLA